MASGLLAAVGLVLTPMCTRLPQGVAIPAAIVAFGMTDVGHDVLLTPSRTAMNDAFDTKTSEQRCAVLSGFAKLLSLTLASVLPDELAFWIVAAIMVGAVMVQIITPNVVTEACQAEKAADGQGTVPVGFQLVWILQTTGWITMCIFSFYFTSIWAQCVGTTPGAPAFSEAVQFASSLLLAQAVVFICAGFVLPRVVHFCGGELIAIPVALLMYAGTMVLFFVASLYENLPWILGIAAALTVVVLPMAYQIIVNAPIAWLEQQPSFDGSERGRLTGWMNASLPVGQCIVAVGSGPLVEAAGGQLVMTFLVVAILNILVVLTAGILSLWRLRPRILGSTARLSSELIAA
jgi:hypothetical protein